MTGKRVVHIGLPKTGTTTLQKFLFQGHPWILPALQTRLRRDDFSRVVLRSLLEEGYAAPEKLARIIDKRANGESVLAVSDEALTFGEFMMRSEHWTIVNDHWRTAQRIREMLGPCEIVVVLRNQVDYLVSYQKQMIRMNREPVRPLEERLDVWERSSNGRFLSALDYRELYDAYVAAFGVGHVHVFLFEQWRSDFSAMGERIAELLEVDPAEARGQLEGAHANRTPDSVREVRREFAFLEPLMKKTGLKRLVPPALAKALKRAAFEPRAIPQLSEDARTRIRAMFDDGNRALFDRLGIDGHGMGYFSEVPSDRQPSSRSVGVS